MAIALLFLLIYSSLTSNVVSARAVSRLAFLSSSTINIPLPENSGSSSISSEVPKSSNKNTDTTFRSYHNMLRNDEVSDKPYVNMQAPSQVTFPHSSFKSLVPDEVDEADTSPSPSPAYENDISRQPTVARHPYDHYRSLRTMQKYHSRILSKRLYYDYTSDKNNPTGYEQTTDNLSTAWNWFIVISVLFSFFFTAWVVWSCERREADGEYLAINRGDLRGSMVRGRRMRCYYGSISTTPSSDSSSEEYMYPQYPYNDLPYPVAASLDPEIGGGIRRENSDRHKPWSWFSFSRRKDSSHYSPKNISTESFNTASSRPASISKGKGRESGSASEGVRRASGNDMHNRLEALDGSNHDHDPTTLYSTPLPHQRSGKHVSFSV